MIESMRIMAKWSENLIGFSDEQTDLLMGKLVRYGLYGELKYTGDPLVDNKLNDLTTEVDNLVAYDREKQEQGKKGGRPSELDDKVIWKMVNEKGLTAKQICAELGIKSPTTLYSRLGWKMRNNPDFIKFG